MKLFRHIKPQYDKKLILARLGYKRGITEFSEEYRALVDQMIQKSESLCDITTAYRTIGIASNLNGMITLEDGTILRGNALSELLKHSNEAVLMASTAGKRITETISELMQNGNASEAVILDSAASEIADAGLDFMMDYIATAIRKEGMTLTRMRFSPGYGDFVIEQQRDFARLLEIDKLGITLTDTCMLLPEKSVLAIAGKVPLDGEQT